MGVQSSWMDELLTSKLNKKIGPHGLKIQNKNEIYIYIYMEIPKK